MLNADSDFSRAGMYLKVFFAGVVAMRGGAGRVVPVPLGTASGPKVVD